jgi:hypothetical protein
MISSKQLWIFGSLVFGLFGTVHLVYTFFTDKFLPRDEKLIEAMNRASPVLSQEISMWKAWIGFNASHSSGIIFLAVINCFLAVKYFTLIQKSHFFFLFNIITVAFYVFLARKYWFIPPLVGVSVTLACYTVAYIMVVLGR